MIKIRGIIQHGHGRAAGCVEQQKQILKDYVPEIFRMFSGTINIKLESALSFAKFDIETPPLNWSPGCTERFQIARASFQLCEPGFGSPVPCLLYYAETSPHRSDPFLVEVVTQKLNKNGTTECLIFLSHECRTVPWIIAG